MSYATAVFYGNFISASYELPSANYAQRNVRTDFFIGIARRLITFSNILAVLGEVTYIWIVGRMRTIKPRSTVERQSVWRMLELSVGVLIRSVDTLDAWVFAELFHRAFFVEPFRVLEETVTTTCVIPLGIQAVACTVCFRARVCQKVIFQFTWRIP